MRNGEYPYSTYIRLKKFISLCLFFEDKEYGPRTVKDVKLICAGKILENNKTVEECQSPLCNLPGGVTTMLVVVQPPNLEKGLEYFLYNMILMMISHYRNYSSHSHMLPKMLPHTI
jgi:hypothetical protein